MNKNIKKVLVLWLGLATTSFASDITSKKTPYRAVVIKQAVVSKEARRYCGWPSIAKLPNGSLAVVYSGDRDWHVCPWGKMKIVFSNNNGLDWSDNKTVTNTPLDDRDAGILVTDKGTILISWFTSLEFTKRKSKFYEKRYTQYAQHAGKLNTEIRQEWKGAWIRRSEDNGRSWSSPIKVPFVTPHGPIQLKNGRILLVTGAGVLESQDDGQSWKMIAEFSVKKNGKLSEVHAVELEDGKIIAMSRAPYLKQFESLDGGYTWSLPVETKISGYPPHLIRLKNGWLVVVYGRRNSLPNGQFACISRDGGKTWDVEHEITLSIADKHRGTQEELGYPPNWDLGYPCSVLLEDDTIWTVYYQVDKPGEWPCIIGTHWKLEINEDGVKSGKKSLIRNTSKER
ncbi:MAG: exo-alpha-sialidase [Pirellulales bacterium]|nr:exo-alpha-sialidase [Pirellulales bacterium]